LTASSIPASVLNRKPAFSFAQASSCGKTSH